MVFPKLKPIPPRNGKHKDCWALSEINFSIKENESFGIVGANGSGKSTILKLLLGTLRPTGARFR